MISKAVTVREKALAKATEKVESEKISKAIAGHAESTVIRLVTAPRAKAQKEKEKTEKEDGEEEEKGETEKKEKENDKEEEKEHSMPR